MEGLGVTHEQLSYKMGFWNVGSSAYAVISGTLTLTMKGQSVVRTGTLAYTSRSAMASGGLGRRLGAVRRSVSFWHTATARQTKVAAGTSIGPAVSRVWVRSRRLKGDQVGRHEPFTSRSKRGSPRKGAKVGSIVSQPGEMNG